LNFPAQTAKPHPFFYLKGNLKAEGSLKDPSAVFQAALPLPARYNARRFPSAAKAA
jgi:hypothetical protein